jgi:hypothetical protein
MRPLFFSTALTLCLWAPLAYAQQPPALPMPPAPLSAPAAEGTPAMPADSAPALPDAPAPSLIVMENAPAIQQVKSLFFSPAELADLRYAASIYRKNTTGRAQDELFDEEDFLKRLTGARKPAEASRYYRYPQFYLESLVYHGPDNWIVWINGQKLTEESPVENASLSVVSIGKEEVALRWRPADMDRVRERWSSTKNEITQVDLVGGTVAFRLHPNQTFSSYSMSVLEGKVQPVTLDTHAAPLPTPSEPEAAPPTLPAAAPAEASREGLPGLINAYSNLGETKPGEPAAPTPAPAAAPIAAPTQGTAP